MPACKKSRSLVPADYPPIASLKTKRRILGIVAGLHLEKTLIFKYGHGICDDILDLFRTQFRVVNGEPFGDAGLGFRQFGYSVEEVFSFIANFRDE